MKHKETLGKMDVAVLLVCMAFTLASLGAVGSTGRRRAKEAVCVSHLKNWGLVWKAHLQDNGGYFAGGPCGGSVLVTWPETTQSYYKNTKVRLCPEATKPYDQGGQPPFAAWSDYGDLPIYASYGTNVWNANSEEQKYWRTAYVARARYVPLMFDTNWRELMPEPYDLPPPYDGYWWTPNRDEMQRVCINRHLGAVNMLFLDFSVRKVGLKHLWHLKWHREWPDDSPLPVWPEWMENFKDY